LRFLIDEFLHYVTHGLLIRKMKYTESIDVSLCKQNGHYSNKMISHTHEILAYLKIFSF